MSVYFSRWDPFLILIIRNSYSNNALRANLRFS